MSISVFRWYIYDQAYSPALGAQMPPPKMMCDVYVVTGEVRSSLYEYDRVNNLK